MSDTLERLREDVTISERPMQDLVGNYLLDADCEIIDAAFRLAEAAPALLDIAEAAPCRRFTMIPCRERPEIPPDDYCAVCKGFAALDSAGGAER